MDDFSPENVAQQVDPLRKLLETRDKLRELAQRMDGNDKLEELLLADHQQHRHPRAARQGTGRSGGGDEPSGEKES